MSKLIFGCGYLGRRVADLWRCQGEAVHAVTRSPAKAADLSASGLKPLVADIGDPASLARVTWPENVETVLFAVGYDRPAGLPIQRVYVDGLRNVLNTLPVETARFIYISSTGVYGDVDGEWVDEEAPTHPVREGGKACLAAEELLLGHPLGQKSIILRLAGLYGPGRIPRAQEILDGQPIDAPAEGWLNLIHAEDAARIVLLADERAVLPALYVVSDGVPVRRAEYYRELARHLHAPEPRFIPPPPTTPAALRAASDKRVRTDRLQRELAPKLLYPTYREGLAAIVSRREEASR